MKKKIIPFLAILAAALVLAAGCKNAAKTEVPADALDADTSYAMGMLIAQEFHLPGIKLNYDAFVEGYQAYIDEKTKFDMDEAIGKIQPVFMAALENQTRDSQDAENTFLEENGKKSGITTTASGLQYEVITQGSGKMPAAYDTVQVHYRGTLTDGTVFDSSYDRGEPAVFPLAGVIPGWTEGLQLMNVGGNFRFYIPSALAYGSSGSGQIPPYAPLIFDVELLSIEDN